ncbi:SusC/RagA family TonB-linked outer membrane protein [Pedobacter sp. KBW01]|uniref:SusC/RagA family TonB-linked outer membrane protein n=1 Tax=Pedobacter sp. KBW01 TaxID=2153364 RepID=UPI000F597F8A|nr:SusC/RagA family TonB-linked outer membrane protein [Pedobacter sp. KBW01]RQO77775.1 SusC/RagA family TonB-linked outer membrane protein [Pedobacter sp. KBW01]
MYQYYTKKTGMAHALYRKIWLIMRLTTVLLIVSLMQLSAASYSQLISINEKNVPLRSVLKEIRKQSGYDFVYDSQLLSTGVKTSISVKNATIEVALKDALSGLPLEYEISGNRVTIRKAKEKTVIADLTARFQAVDVRGKVVDEAGNGLAGATVSVKGGKGSVITGSGGEFLLKNINEDAVLTISYLGFVTREVKVGREELLIRLVVSNSKLDEVQVQAYGTTSRRVATGNISTVKADDIVKQPVNNPLLALQGRIPGMTIDQQSGVPGAALKIKVRGQNSLNYSEPLYVVDGVPIDPNVQSVLGAMPLAVDNNGFGRQAISAFSLINSADIASIDVLKDADATSIYGSRGANGVVLITTKRGEAGTTKVNFNLSHGASEVSRRLALLNTRQYLDMRYQAFRNNNLPVPTTPIFNNYDLTAFDTTRYTDWQKELLGGVASLTNLQMSVTGGSKTVQYIINGGYQKETNPTVGDYGDQKGNLHVGLNGSSLDNKLKTQLNLSYLINNNTAPPTDFTAAAMTLAPNAPALRDSNGDINWQTLPNGNSAWTNPLAALNNLYTARNHNLISSGLVSYSFGYGIGAKISGGYNLTQGETFQGTPFSAIAPERRPDGLRNALRFNSTASSWVVEPQLTIERIIGPGKFSALLGGTLQENSNGSIKTDAEGFPDDQSLGNFAAATMFRSETSENLYKYSAVFARLNYNIGDRYIVNISGRRDGSSRFGPGNQFGNFGSVGAAWIFGDEKWIKENIGVLSFGKLRASYGSSGNDQIPDYKYMKLYSYTQENYQDKKALSIDGLYDGYFHWEVTRKMELGLDLGLFNNRILINVAYYRNRSGNQLVEVALPSFVGTGTIRVNRDALVQNSGVEFSLSTVNIRTKNFTWTTSFNISANNNKLLRYPDLAGSVDDAVLDIGQPLNRNIVYKYAGVDPQTGLYQFYDKNGNVTSSPVGEDAAYFVSTMPKYFGGLMNGFSYKGLSLEFLLQFSKRIGKNYITGPRPGGFNGGLIGNQPITVLDNWKKPGDQATIQKFSQNSSLNNLNSIFQSSDAVYTDASYIRLKNVSVSYDLLTLLPKQRIFKSFRLVASGQNLFTITRYKGLDPETMSTVFMPPLRTLTAGLQIGL